MAELQGVTVGIPLGMPEQMRTIMGLRRMWDDAPVLRRPATADAVGPDLSEAETPVVVGHGDDEAPDDDESEPQSGPDPAATTVGRALAPRKGRRLP